MGKIFKLDLPTNGIRTKIVFSDVHALYSHRPALNVLKKFIQSRKKSQTDMIINGDLADVDYFMARNEQYQTWIGRKDGVEEYFYPEYQKEIEWMNNFFDEFRPLVSECDYLMGNHEFRWENAMHSIPRHSHHLFDYKKDMSFDKRKIRTYQHNSWLDYGPNLTFTHGHSCSSTALKKHFELSKGRSVVYGHVHDFGVKSFQVRGETSQVISLPCLSTLNPSYLKMHENNWTYGFMELIMRPNGIFHWYVYQIWNDELILPNGKIITA
jgi:UDP-2,3-diacylglucosamine pyrophosphatase LpxH